MSGRIVFTPPPPDACKVAGCEGKPKASLYRPGTIWQCDKCSRRWSVVTGSQYNEVYFAWRRVPVPFGGAK